MSENLRVERGWIIVNGTRQDGRVSDVSEERAYANWALYAPSAFDGGAPGAMNADRWRDTVAHVAKTHGLSRLPGELVYRSEPLAGAGERIAA